MRKKLAQISIVFMLMLSYSFVSTDRNIIYIFTDANDQLFFEYEPFVLSNLTDTLKIIIKNEDNSYIFPEKRKKEIPFFGKTMVSRAVVSIGTQRGTSYKFYIQVQNEIERAYNELRDELAIEHFKKPYKQLANDKKAAINKIYPKRISEAEPN